MDSTDTPTLLLRSDLAALSAHVHAMNYSGCWGNGEPFRKASKIINGHHVSVTMVGFGNERAPWFNVDKSSKQLGIDEAIAAVLA